MWIMTNSRNDMYILHIQISLEAIVRKVEITNIKIFVWRVYWSLFHLM